MSPRQKKLLIVGAKGYVGGALFAEASRRGGVIGTSSAGDKGLTGLQLEAPANFDYKMIGPGDVIMVTAAISAPDFCAQNYDRAWDVNVTGTTFFISKAIERGARIIFFSSDAVYGEQVNAFDETASCNPAGVYAAMKHEVEQRFFGSPNFKSIRLSFIFSREDKFTKYLTECAKNDEEAEVFCSFYRAIIYRGDVVTGALELAENWEKISDPVINFGGPQVLSRVEFAECIKNAFLENLRYRVIDPGDDFFQNRPRVISMTSPVLDRLLKRAPHSVFEGLIP